MLLSRLQILRSPVRVFKRFILTESYACTEKWDSRFHSKYYGNFSASDLGTQILYRLSSQAPVDPLDYDIFVNRVQQADKSFLEFLEKVTLKFRLTQNSLKILDSTHHAFVRNYIYYNESHRVLEHLKNRSRFGIFLDEVSASLLQDSFIKSKDYFAALSVMWELCLQSHLELQSLTPYITALWLHTANVLLKTEPLLEGIEVVEKNEEQVNASVDYRSVPYLRNPNYDAWFDVTRPRLQLGYCLLSLCSAFERNLPLPLQGKPSKGIQNITPRLRLVGYALLENYAELLDLASNPPESVRLDANTILTIERLIESSSCRPDDSQIKVGEPTILTQSEISLVSKKFKVLIPTLSTTEEDMSQTIDDLVSGIVNDAFIGQWERGRVERLYASFEAVRATSWTRMGEVAQRHAAVTDVKTRLRALADTEESLSAFLCAPELESAAWLAPRTRAERRYSRLQHWKMDLQRHQLRKQGGRAFTEV